MFEIYYNNPCYGIGEIQTLKGHIIDFSNLTGMLISRSIVFTRPSISLLDGEIFLNNGGYIL